MSEEELRGICDRAIPAMNQAADLYAAVPSHNQWALIADANRARDELTRRMGASGS